MSPDMNMSGVASHAGLITKYFLDNWALDPAISIPFIIVPLVLYYRGWQVARIRKANGEEVLGYDHVSMPVFLTGMALWIIGAMSPLMYWSMVYLWAHTLFHVIMMIGAPPLILYGKPWRLMRLGIPERLEPAYLTLVTHLKEGRVLRPIVRLVTNPWVDLAYFTFTMWIWFYPAIMTYAVDNKYIMLLMHFTFISSGLLLFINLIESPPYQSRFRTPIVRLGVILFTAYSSWMLAMLMGLATKPWFPVYWHIPGKVLSPMADQELAASVLWVLCMEPFVYSGYHNIKLWLTLSEEHKISEFIQPWLKHVRRPGTIPGRITPIEASTQIEDAVIVPQEGIAPQFEAG
ncbi:MAG: cytochrome c oxidase assembly protein [Acidimicrobiales bacterium]